MESISRRGFSLPVPDKTRYFFAAVSECRNRRTAMRTGFLPSSPDDLPVLKIYGGE